MKLAHITMYSAHYEESVRFYQEICGLKIRNAFEGPMNITFLVNEDGDTAVEIIQAKDPAEAYQGQAISMGFGVADVAAYREELEGKGYAPTPMISPNPMTHFFYVEDPNGFKVQFINE